MKELTIPLAVLAITLDTSGFTRHGSGNVPGIVEFPLPLSAAAMSPRSQSSPRDSEIVKLDFFVGDWNSEATLFPGKFGPGGKTTGATHYQWGIGNMWLLFDSKFPLPGMGAYEVHGLVAYDPKERRYTSYAFNNLAPRGIEYTGEWKDAHTLVFTSITKLGSGMWARVVYEWLPEGTIRFRSEESTNGSTFTPYFEAIMSRK